MRLFKQTRLFLLALAVLLSFAAVPSARAQCQSYTTVTGTVTDPSGIPYAGATLYADISPSASTSPSCTSISGGQQALAPSDLHKTVTLDATGSFSLQLPPNAIITPASSSWVFTVNLNSPGPIGTGILTFTYSATISGSSQSLSSGLSALAQSVSHVASGSPSGAAGASSTLFQQVGPSSPVLTKGGTYNGWTANALAAPGFTSDGTQFVQTVSMWSIANSQWASGFFTSPLNGSNALKTWTYVAGSLISPTGGDYIAGNGDIIYFGGTYYFLYAHYANGSATCGPIAIRTASTIVGLASATPSQLVANNYCDASFSLNPDGVTLEIWATNSANNRTLSEWTCTSSCGTGGSWTGPTALFNYPSSLGGGGEPSVFYIGTQRFMVVDSYPSVLGGRYTSLFVSPSQNSTWYGLGTAIIPYPLNAWQQDQVFDADCRMVDTGDGLGAVPRCLFAGSDNTSGGDNTDSSIGYATGLQSYNNLLSTLACYPLAFLTTPTTLGYDMNLCWNPLTQLLSAQISGFQILDTFVGTSGVQVTAHPTNTGQSWVGWSQHSAGGDCTTWTTATLSGSGTAANSSATCDTSLYANYSPASANYTVCGTATVTSGAINFDISGRLSSGADTRYVVNENPANSGFKLLKAVAGTYTQLGSTATFSWSGSHTLCLVMSGTSISATLDGTTDIGPVTDSAISASGFAGMTLGGNGEGGGTVTISNFSVK